MQHGDAMDGGLTGMDIRDAVDVEFEGGSPDGVSVAARAFARRRVDDQR